MLMPLFLQYALWSIIGDSGFVVSSLGSSASTFFSFHLLTGKMGTRPGLKILSTHSAGPSEIKLWGFLYSEWGEEGLA
jgi:hypothetical protein